MFSFILKISSLQHMRYQQNYSMINQLIKMNRFLAKLCTKLVRIPAQDDALRKVKQSLMSTKTIGYR